MSRLDQTTRSFLARGWFLGAAAAIFFPLALPALADSQPSSTWTSDRTAYDRALALGSTSALRNFLMAYPNSPLADRALEWLVQHCTSLHPQGAGSQYSDSSCDLQDLISPAAGPSNNTSFTDPPTEHSARDTASNT
jgi:hypothetical protein